MSAEEVKLTTVDGTLEMLRRCRDPFPPHQILYMMRGGTRLHYVGHAALTDRLLDIDPLWTWEPLAYDAHGLPAIDDEGGLWIKLTICGVTRLGYGDAQGKTGGNAMKERIGDALRNAGMRFGLALDLWHKGDLHAATEEEERPAPRREEAKPPPAGKPDEVEIMARWNEIINSFGFQGDQLILLHFLTGKDEPTLTDRQNANRMRTADWKAAIARYEKETAKPTFRQHMLRQTRDAWQAANLLTPTAALLANVCGLTDIQEDFTFKWTALDNVALLKAKFYAEKGTVLDLDDTAIRDTLASMKAEYDGDTDPFANEL